MTYRGAAGQLILSCLLGIFCGAGVGFFIFLRLGFPRPAQTAGYISGLFLMAGLQFGLAVGICRILYFEFSWRRRGKEGETSNTRSDAPGLLGGGSSEFFKTSRLVDFSRENGHSLARMAGGVPSAASNVAAQTTAIRIEQQTSPAVSESGPRILGDTDAPESAGTRSELQKCNSSARYL